MRVNITSDILGAKPGISKDMSYESHVKLCKVIPSITSILDPSMFSHQNISCSNWFQLNLGVLQWLPLFMC